MYNMNLKKSIAGHKLLVALIITGVLSLFQTACSGTAAGSSTTIPASNSSTSPAAQLTPIEVVTVSMTDFAYKFTPSTIKAGQVKFVVKNDSTTQLHEIWLVKTDLAVDKLPMAADGASIDEGSTQFTKLGSVEDVAAGASGEMTVKLEPGRYVYFCNKPGHYKMGMASEMTVVQ
jgi:uncharacterized cupredoxin-like copper-binding protein